MTISKLHLAILFSCGFSASLSATESTSLVGTVSHLRGELVSLEMDSDSRRALTKNSAVNEGDLLITAKQSYARIKFTDGGNLIIRPNSEIRIENYRFKTDAPEQDRYTLNLLKGSLRSITGLIGKRNPDRQLTYTSHATIGIRGTHFGLLLCAQEQDCIDETNLAGQVPDAGLYIDVMEGAVTAINDGGRQQISAGQYSHIENNTRVARILTAEEAVRVGIPSSMVGDTIEEDCLD
ncbi:MAG: hypothetical protein AseanaTS_21450 [Candidatus Pelagadaptatus aseana]|uniref:FecR family protein n=1 Tax=Candidatus Pelagadaptatus aseana TaxID=3120508 RepID=UPI0039B1E02D